MQNFKWNRIKNSDKPIVNICVYELFSSETSQIYKAKSISKKEKKIDIYTHYVVLPLIYEEGILF